MPVKKVGVEYEVKGINQFISAIEKAGKAMQRLTAAVEKTAQLFEQISSGMAKSQQAAQQYASGVSAAQQTQQSFNNAMSQGVAASQQVAQTTERVTRVTKTTTRVVKRHSAAWEMNAKKLILWSLGARTVFRLFMRLRNMLRDTFLQLYENTEGWKRFTEALEPARIALVLMVAPADDVSEALERGATFTITLTRTLLLLGAAVGTAGEFLKNFTGALGVYWEVIQAIATGREFEAIAKQMEEFIFEPGELGEIFIGEFEKRYLQLQDTLNEIDDERADAFEKYQQRLYQIQEQWLKKRLDIEKRYLQQVDDAEKQFQEDIADAFQERADERADAWQDLQDKLAQIEEDGQHRRQQLQERFEERMQRIRYQFERGSKNARYQHNRRMLRIERQYQERLRQIQITFSESMYDAIAARDATAALRAMRRRDRDIDTAQRQAEGQRQEAREDFARRMFELQRDLDHQTEMAKLAYERQLRDLEYALEQRREKAWDAYQKALEDAQESYGKEEKALKDSLDKRLKDLHDHYVQAIADAKFQRELDLDFAEIDYTNAENALERHLQKMQALRRAYAGIGVTLPPTPRPRERRAAGGEFIAYQPTTLTVGEGGIPEFVSVTPLDRPVSATPTVTHSIAGSVGHNIDVMVSRSVAGMEGRINAALERALTDLLR